jgi:predicted dehydrogenase
MAMTSRRQFLQVASASTVAALSPTFARAQTTSATASAPVQIGFMGLNGRGQALIDAFLATQRTQVRWLADVDRRALESAGKRVHARQSQPFQVTHDFRRALEDPQLDALVIAAPVHWHAPAAILALQAGKHVYLEKPVSHNPQEGEWLVAAARQAGKVVQVGLQRRSVPWVQEALDKVRSGELGPVRFTRAWYTNRRGSIGHGQSTPVPEWLDYSLWQGPAPERPFQSNVVHYNWHWFWHWGAGELGNNGVHFLDLVQSALQLPYPTRVLASGSRDWFDDDQETPDTQIVTYEFPGAIVLWEHRSCLPLGLEGEATGIAFQGRDATLILGTQGYRILDPKGTVTHQASGDVPTVPHVHRFLDAMAQPDIQPSAPVDEAHRATLLCHLGNIAYRHRAPIELDPTTGRPRNDEVTARYWGREYRNGWQPKVG